MQNFHFGFEWIPELDVFESDFSFQIIWHGVDVIIDDFGLVIINLEEPFPVFEEVLVVLVLGLNFVEGHL